MRDVNKMLVEKTKLITKTIAPEYPLGYSDLYPIVFNYLSECYVDKTRYDSTEMNKRVMNFVLKDC